MWIVRQVMRLLIGEFLKAVFDHAQKSVSPGEFTACLSGDEFFTQKGLQDGLYGALLQRRNDSAPQKLKNLSEKLDFADTAVTQFDVAIHPPPFHLQGDLAFHIPE